MRTLLFTGHDDAYAPLAAITVPRMQSYALKRDMDFHCFTEPLIDVPNGIYWTGVCGALKAFKMGYDRAFYLDCDQLITNFDNDPTIGADYGFWVSQDWGEDAVEPWHFSACGWYAHQNCIPMLAAVRAMEQAWRDKPFQEQGPWQSWVRDRMEGTPLMPREPNDPSGLINVMKRRYFNAVPDEVCPGKVPEPWVKTDFAAHITMADLPRRIEIAQKILKSL